MDVTEREYRLILEPGSEIHKWVMYYMNSSNDFDDWLESRSAHTTVEWIDGEFKRILVFDSESAWWEFRLAWL